MKLGVAALLPLRLQSCTVKGNKVVSRLSESVSFSYPPSLEASGFGFEKTLLN